jgi:hypothetical protein
MRRWTIGSVVAVGALLAGSAAIAVDGDPVPSFGTNGRVTVPSAVSPSISGLVSIGSTVYLAHTGERSVLDPLAPFITTITAIDPSNSRMVCQDCALYGPDVNGDAAYAVEGDRVEALVTGGVGLTQFQVPGAVLGRVTPTTPNGAFFVEIFPTSAPADAHLELHPADGGAARRIGPIGRPEPLLDGRLAVASITTASPSSVLTVRWYGADGSVDRTRASDGEFSVAYPTQLVTVLATLSTASGGLDLIVGSQDSGENAQGRPLTSTLLRFDESGHEVGSIPIVTADWLPAAVELPGRGVVLVGTTGQGGGIGGRPAGESLVVRIVPDASTPVTMKSFGIGSDLIDGAVADRSGRLVVVGGTRTPPGSSRTALTVRRLRADDTVDPTFGTNGLTTLSLPIPTDNRFAVSMGADGTITTAFPQESGNPPRADSSFIIVDQLSGSVPRALTDRGGVTAPLPAPIAGRFVALPPTRVLDTRVAGGQFEPGEARNIDLKSLATGTLGFAVNLTGTGPQGPGYARLGSTSPGGETSTLNFSAAGETVANATVVVPDEQGTVALFSQTAADYVLDVTGYWLPATSAQGGRLQVITPARLLDTRDGDAPRRPADSTIDLKIVGRGGVPSNGVSAVALAVTSVDSVAEGYLTVWPSGVAQPLASTLNPTGAQDIRSNLAIVPVGAAGTVSIYTKSATDLVVDVLAWFTDDTAALSAQGLVVLALPKRTSDTRSGEPPGALRPGEVRTLSVGIQPPAAIYNLTATNTRDAGFVTAFPVGADLPPTSNVNFDAPGQSRASMAITATASGDIKLYSNVGADVVVDALAYVTR